MASIADNPRPAAAAVFSALKCNCVILAQSLFKALKFTAVANGDWIG